MKSNILLFYLFTNIVSLAQVDSVKKVNDSERLKITDYYLMPGFNFSVSNYVSIDDFRKLNPDAEILKSDFTDYTQTSYRSFDVNSQVAFKLGLKLNQKNSKQLQIGLLHSTYNNLNAHYFKSDKTRFDTINSSSTGNIYYLDSVHTTNYSFAYQAKIISFNVAFIFRTNPEARWGLYGGFGLGAGASYKSITSVFVNNYYSVETRKPNGEMVATSYSNIENGYKNVYLRNKPSFLFMLHLPMGIDFRLGKKREFFKRIHLFYELQPAFQLNLVHSIGGKFSTSVANSLGIRVTF